MRTRFVLGLTGLALACLAGCVSPLPHTPNLGAVQEMGRDKAASRLEDLMVRARAPQITSAEVQDDALVYSAAGISPWWYTPNQGKAAILFSALDRIDLYENSRTFVYDAAGRELSVILHQTVEDGREFIDLLLSFQATWRSGGDDSPSERGEEPANEPNETKTDLMKEDGSSADEGEPEGDEVKKDLMKDD